MLYVEDQHFAQIVGIAGLRFGQFLLNDLYSAIDM